MKDSIFQRFRKRIELLKYLPCMNFILRAIVKKADMMAWHTHVVLLLDRQEEELWAY